MKMKKNNNNEEIPPVRSSENVGPNEQGEVKRPRQIQPRQHVKYEIEEDETMPE